jgi:ribonucleoside-triphosphate reductase
MLREQLVAEYKDYRVPFGPIGEPVYRRTYSHTKPDGRKESWQETVIRAVLGNVLLAGRAIPRLVEPLDPDYSLKVLIESGLIEEDEVQKLIELLMPFDGLPAGRHLNASGVEGRQFLFNCHGSGWDYQIPWAHFTFLFDALMQGGGVGSNYSNRYLNQMPKIETGLDLHIICREDHPDIHEFHHLLTVPGRKGGGYIDVRDAAHQENVYCVPDSREGWVESVGILMQKAFTPTNTISREAKLVLDVSDIRIRGSALKTSGGIACGPGPFVSMIADFTKQLNGCYDTKLTSLDAMALDHIEASCVVAGGKRRSSRMSVKNWEDHDIFEFINCKREDGAHWSTNISVETDDEFEAAYRGGSEHAKAVAHAIVLGSRTNGEPGVWNRSRSMKGEREPELMFCPNPCGEIGLQMWENCNLGHINLQHFAQRPIWAMEEAFRLMTRWLVRATFGDIPDPRQREVVNRNRRIGVGFFGYHGFLALRGIKYSDSWHNEEVISTLKQCLGRVDHEAYRYTQQLGIPQPVKTTTLAPTGTIAILPGVTSSAQSIYAGWFKRLVRYSSMDPELAVKKLEGYPVYPDTDARNTEIVEYWCEDPLVTAVRAQGFDPAELIEAQDDISLETALNVQSMLQEVWANNGISYTINLPMDNMPSESEMEATLMRFHSRIKGTTIFPDKSRKNAPLQRLTKQEFDAYPGNKEVMTVENVCVGACPVK